MMSLRPRLLALLLPLLLAAPAAQAEFELYRELPVIKDLRENNLDGLKRELVTGTSANVTDTDGQPILLLAARLGKAAAVDLLLSHGARPDGRDRFGNTPLMWAADQGHTAVVERLLAAKADPNAANGQGLTPLIRAVRAGQAGAVRALLDGGADPLLADYTGRDALSWASESRNPQVRRLVEDAAR